MASDVNQQPPGPPAGPRPRGPRNQPRRRRPSGSATAARRRPAPPRAEAGATAHEPSSDHGKPPSQKKAVVVLSVLTVAVVALAAFGFVLSSRSGPEAPPPAGETPVPVRTFTDRQTGFTIEYPRSWRQVDVPLADYRLALDGGNNVALTIRVVPVAEPATTANLQNFKAYTDGAVALNSSVTILKQQAVTYNGMLGYYYFYTFRDGPVEAVHAHYFLFSGKKMNILVFQSFPDDFERLAGTFDRIAESFRSDPNVELPGIPPITTTATSVP